MIIELNDTLRTEIGVFLPHFRAEIDSLRETEQRLADIAERNENNGAALARSEEVSSLADKEISQRLVCRERARTLSTLATKHEHTARERRAAVAPLAHQAAELFRRAASHPLFAQAESDLIESLPEAIRADKNLIFRIIAESSGKRAVGRFLNPQVMGPRDDSGTILEESDRRAQFLDDLLNGRDIAVPGIAVAA